MSSETRITGANLPFRVEQWKNGSLKRILGLAAQAGLARAIYTAAKSDYPDDKIVLFRDNEIIARTDEQGAG